MLKRLASWAFILVFAAGIVYGAAAIIPTYQGLIINGNGTLTLNGTATTAVRTVLTGNATYYVNANPSGTAACGPTGALTCQPGSDSNDGLSVSTPFLTLQNAYQVIADTIDVNGFSVTINLAHGSSTNYDLNCNGGPFLGAQFITVQGDGSAITAVTIVDPNNGYGLIVTGACRLSAANIAFADSASMNALGHVISTGGLLIYNSLTLGGLTNGTQMSVTGTGLITAAGGLRITNSAPIMLSAVGPGLINFRSFNVAIITSSLVYAGEVAFMADGGEILANGSTFNGAGLASLTGARCQILGPSSTNGIDPNTIFPGSGNCIQNVLQGMTALTGQTYSALTTCNGGAAGTVAYITDSTTNTWGATIAGTGSNKVLGFCDGSNWTVAGK